MIPSQSASVQSGADFSEASASSSNDAYEVFSPQEKKYIGLAAQRPSTVLIHGESGTGKELMARRIHALSPRSSGPFVAINCAGIPDMLLETELFGHVKGAFTDAAQNRRGKILAANGGTLFMDEIADLSLPAQAKLLRVLQERELSPLGSNLTIPFDVRFIAASNKRLTKEVEQGRFRADLYYRLNVLTLDLKPFRNLTPEQKTGIAQHVMNSLNRNHGYEPQKAKRLSKEALDAITAYSWPGNIRELQNILERALILSEDIEIQAADLDIKPLHEPRPDLNDDDLIRLLVESTRRPLDNLTQSVSAQYARVALERSGGNVLHASKAIGLSRSMFYRSFSSVIEEFRPADNDAARPDLAQD